MSEAGGQEARLHTPDEIAAMLGGISIKTLNDLIRDRGLQTTTLGYAPPSRKGRPPAPHLGDDRRTARRPDGRASPPGPG